jgi:peptide/nickel transport system substrate-binding protein
MTMGSHSGGGGARRHGALLLAAAVVLSASLVWGLASALAESPSPSPGTGKVTLHVGWVEEPDNLNPFIGYASAAYEIWHLNYNLLVGYRAADLAPQPELCTELPTKENGGVSADGKTVTFHIRPNVKWQDGEPLTAADVAFTYNYINADPENTSALSGYTKFITNVEATDDTTVVFHCSQPKANLIRMWIPILPEHIWRDVPQKVVGDTYENKPPIVGSGPFQCVEFSKGHYAKMERNPLYWGPKPKIDEIVFETYQNADNMASDLEAGRIDVAWGLPAARFQQMKAKDGSGSLTLTAYSTRMFNYLGMNCYQSKWSMGAPALRDVKFRQALNWAIDRKQLTDVAEYGFAVPADTLLTGVKYGDVDYHYEVTADQKMGFDPEKAKQLLDEAGYVDANGDGVRDYANGKPIKLRLWGRTEDEFSQTAGRLITSWLQGIGLKVDFSVLDEGTIYDRSYYYDKAGHYAPDWDMYIWDWVGYADPSDTLVSWTTGQIEVGWNDACWSNKEFDTLFDQQLQAVDPQTGADDNMARRDLIWRMQDIFYQDSPYVVLDYPQDREGYNTAKWEGWVPIAGGAVVCQNDNIDTYLYVQPKVASAAGAAGGSSTWIWVSMAVAAAAIVIVVVLLRRGRGPGAEEM